MKGQVTAFELHFTEVRQAAFFATSSDDAKLSNKYMLFHPGALERASDMAKA